MVSWEQIALGQVKRRCPVWKVSVNFEAKRVCEAERKRRAQSQSLGIIIRVVIIFRIDLLYLQQTVQS